MNALPDHTTMNRTAKYFMDNGRAETFDEAMTTLRGFGVSVIVGPEIEWSPPHQIALLTFVNAARRTFLGGVEVVGPLTGPLLVPLASAGTIGGAVRLLGGQIVAKAANVWPTVAIGTCSCPLSDAGWQITWEGWRGGVLPLAFGHRLAENSTNPLAAALAAAIGCAELFAWHAKDHPMAGKRHAGLSLWRPCTDWLVPHQDEPTLQYLPSQLWLIGLGNLGQAFAWSLACLPYPDAGNVTLVLQDFDRIAPSNDSTSLLASLDLVGRMKTRSVAAWLEHAGFKTILNEHRFGPWTVCGPHDPRVALCGVDNAAARADLDKPGFGLVIEAGLGAGPDGFRNFSLHTFPAARRPDEIWPRDAANSKPDVSNRPAYAALQQAGVDTCGLAQLASRTVGVPFVGLIAGALVISEPLRRLHGACGLEMLSGSALSLPDVESCTLTAEPYAFGHVTIDGVGQ